MFFFIVTHLKPGQHTKSRVGMEIESPPLANSSLTLDKLCVLLETKWRMWNLFHFLFVTRSRYNSKSQIELADCLLVQAFVWVPH